MHQKSNVPENRNETRLPLRDWIILPLLGLFTIGAIAGITEYVAQRKYPTVQSRGPSCTVYSGDPINGPHGVPNCRTWGQVPETELTEYRFNACGFRTDLPCGPKPRGTFRIVMIGTSFAAGWDVPVEKTFGDLLPKELSRMTGRNIQLYNESFPYRLPDLISSHFDAVLKAQPDMILWGLNAGDFERQAEAVLPPDGIEGQPLNRRQRVMRDLKEALGQGSLEKMAGSLFTHTRTYNLLSDFIYASPSQYLKVAMDTPDQQIGYLRIHLSKTWQRKFREFNVDFASVAAQARVAHIPLVVTLLPNRAEAAMLALGTPPAGYDPQLMDARIQAIATRNGATYVAVAPGLGKYLNPQLGYYPTEGHPNVRGHAMFADILARELEPYIADRMHVTRPTRHQQQAP